MSVNTFVSQYRGWTIDHVWNEEFQRWDQVAVQGDTRLESGSMNWYQFTVAMDRADGRPIFEDFIERLVPGREVWPWTSEAAPVKPDASEEDDEGFQTCPERESRVDWKPGERKVWDWDGALSQRDLRALSRLNLPLERQTLVSKPRPLSMFQDPSAKISAFDGEVCLEIDLAVYGDALGIYGVAFTHPKSMCSGGYGGSCMPPSLLRQAVNLILQDMQAPPALVESTPAPIRGWVQQSLFDLEAFA